MKSISRFISMILTANLLTYSAGITPAVASINMSPKNTSLSRTVQSKKMDLNARARAESAFAKLPLCFEANRGQIDSSVKFMARGRGYSLFLTPKEAVLALQKPAAAKAKGQDVVRMNLKGANANPVVEGLGILQSKSNYMIGSDQKKWHTNVEQYSKVQYKQVYNGIDLVYYGNQGQLEYDFVVAPGANPGLIKMNFKGAKNIEIDKQGNLVLNLKESRIAFGSLMLYQKTGDTKVPVDGRFVLAGNKQVCFAVGAYDKSKELVIDPTMGTIVYSTYLGTTVADQANAIAVENDGTVYLTGQTVTVADKFPGTAGNYQSANAGGNDAFVIKLSPAGAIVWATYLGGTVEDIGLSIAVDAAHIVYVCGSTTSGNFPTKNPYQTYRGATLTNGFITAIKADGSGLVYSTFLGGAGPDFCNAITVDSLGNAYVTGGTSSNNTLGTGMPATAGAYQIQNGGGAGGVANAFVAKFNPAGGIQYLTYLGGGTAGDATHTTQGNAITIDATGNIYITGSTLAGLPTFPSGVLPLARAFKLAIGGAQDSFVAKIAPNGNGNSDLLYCSYLGGSGLSKGTGIKLDNLGNVYVAGDNNSTDFPDPATDGVTVGFPKVGQTTIAGGPFDCYVMKLAMNGTGHSDGIYCTFLGGNNDDRSAALMVDSFGDAYVTGRTMSPDFVSLSPTSILTPLDSTLGATAKVFLAAIGPDGSTRELKTYIGGVTDQAGTGIAVDGAHNIYIGGWTSSTDFPTAGPMGSGAGALFPALNGAASFDAFVLKISAPYPNPIPTITSVNPPGGVAAGNTTVVIGGTGFTGVTGLTGLKFGGINANSYIVNSSTQITAISPAGPAGTVVDIRAANAAGTSAIVADDQYTYFLVSSTTAAPTVTGLNPILGTSLGGTTVLITGTGFTSVTGANGVKFGDLVASTYTVISDTKISATTKKHAIGIVDVVVTSLYGISPITAADQYTYFLTPVIPGTGAVVNPFDPYVFPSPTRGNTAGLAYYMASSGVMTAHIYNEIGQLVDTIQDSKPAGAQGSTISVGRFAPGVYLCHVSMKYDDGTTHKYSRIKFAVIH